MGITMELNDLYIGDGIIECYNFKNDTLTVIFKDFQNSVYNLQFYGCTSIEENGSVGFSLCKAQANENQWVVQDDDGQVLAVTFSSVKISKEC